MNNIIEIGHLKKSFGDVHAVDDLSFCVKEGELFAFLGINGAGKSTTINIMCGQLAKDSGTVSICGTDLDKDMDLVKRSLGVVIQGSVLDRELSVYDNLESRAALYGIHGAAFRARFSELSEMLEFSDLRKRTVGKLSGGQRRRIDIARALLHKPKILILDEPTTGLDPEERIRFRGIISDHSQQKLVLLSTHIVSDLEAVANEIILLRKGVVLEMQKPASLLEHLNGQVWLVTVPAADETALTKQYVCSNVMHTDGKSVIRLLSESAPRPDAVPTAPNMEDLYLYYFGR